MCQANGSITWKLEPRPSSLSTATLPPWALTRRCTIASPSPLPPVSRARALSVR